MLNTHYNDVGLLFTCSLSLLHETTKFSLKPLRSLHPLLTHTVPAVGVQLVVGGTAAPVATLRVGAVVLTASILHGALVYV